MAIRAEKITVIDQTWLETNKNERAEQSLYDRATGYMGSTTGTFRALQAMQKTLKLFHAVVESLGKTASSTMVRFEERLGVAVNALVFARLPHAVSEGAKSFHEMQNAQDDGIPFARKMAKAMRDASDALATVGLSLLFIKQNPVVGQITQAADLTADAMDLQISAEDYYQAAKLEQVAVGDAKEAIAHTKNYNFWRVVKAATSVAGTILPLLAGILAAALGFPLIPAIALIALSLFSTGAAIWRDNYKGMGKYQVIDLDRP